MKLHLAKRARNHVQRQEEWWAENRPAAPELFAREFKARLLDDVYRAVPIGIDLVVLTPSEFESGCRDRMGIFDAIVREGVSLYERASDRT